MVVNGLITEAENAAIKGRIMAIKKRLKAEDESNDS